MQAVTSVKYYKGGNSKTYGTLLSRFEEWNYSDTKILLGVQGRLDRTTIKQLGFLSLYTEMESCPDPLDIILLPETTEEDTTEASIET